MAADEAVLSVLLERVLRNRGHLQR
jgi:hypothetical protein